MSVSISPSGDAAIGRKELADEERIKKALQKTTGFPLEQEIANVLLSRNHVVFGNVLFEDGERVKEIDIEAILHVADSCFEQKWFVTPFLPIECKMTRKYTWVFYRNVDTQRHVSCAQEMDPVCLKFDRQNHLLYLGLFRHYAEERDRICSSHTVLDASRGRPGGRDDVFDAVSKVGKFVTNRLQMLRDKYRPDRRDIFFFFPVIVFDGPMYQAEYRSGAMSVRAADAVILQTSIVSPLSGQVSPLYIDVVRRDRFPALLTSIESTADSANEMLANRKVRAILERARRAADVLSSCRTIDLIAKYSVHVKR
jgi:hypothetical protein